MSTTNISTEMSIDLVSKKLREFARYCGKHPGRVLIHYDGIRFTKIEPTPVMPIEDEVGSR